MSDRVGESPRMQTKQMMWRIRVRISGRCVAAFGAARLERLGRGGYALVGGSRRDRLEAKEWASMFLPEAVIPVRARSRCAG